MKLVILQQQFLPRLFLKAYHGRTSCFMQNHIDLRLIAVSLLQLILYVFDRELRSLIFTAIQDIESAAEGKAKSA